MQPFPFAKVSDVQINPKADYVARIGANIHDKGNLLKEIGTKLRFPPYYVTPNWDGFHDWMCDLTWINQSRILLLHDATPHLPRKELKIYLEIMYDAERALDEVGRKLVVAFPEATRSLLEAWSGARRP